MAGAVDFSLAKSYAPIAGEEDATFVEAKYIAESKSSGKPAVTLSFTLNGAEVEGRKVKTTASLSEEGMWKSKQYLVALGADPEDVEGPIADIEEFCAQFYGNTVTLVLSVGSYTPNSGPDAGKPRATQQIDNIKSTYEI